MKSISKEEVKVIHECIWASAYGPFFIDSNYKDNPFWEIHAIFGLTMEELRKIADALPNINPETEDSILAINNSLNNLLGYPHKCTDEVWAKYISVSKEEVLRIFYKWKSTRS